MYLVLCPANIIQDLTSILYFILVCCRNFLLTLPTVRTYSDHKYYRNTCVRVLCAQSSSGVEGLSVETINSSLILQASLVFYANWKRSGMTKTSWMYFERSLFLVRNAKILENLATCCCKQIYNFLAQQLNKCQKWTVHSVQWIMDYNLCTTIGFECWGLQLRMQLFKTKNKIGLHIIPSTICFFVQIESKGRTI